MPAKIIDQYTDRTDLSDKQKFKLRHPERYKEIMRTSHLKWRDENWATLLEHGNKAYNQRRAKVFEKRNANKMMLIQSTGKTSISARKEILSLHSRGKDVGRIAVWMNLPVSCIMAVIEQNKPKQKEGA